MSPPRNSRFLALLLALVPGWGQVYLGHELLGLSLFTGAALCSFAVVNLVLLGQGEEGVLPAQAAASCGLLLWLLAFCDVWRRTSGRRRERLEGEKSRLLREGMLAYLRDELEGAERCFHACLSLDHLEVEAAVRLAIVAARKGEGRRARRLLRRARRLDLDEKWGWEIERELEALRGHAGPPERSSASPPSPAPQGAGAETLPSLEVKAR